MKKHYRDIRLSNNAGIDFPLCYAGAEIKIADNEPILSMLNEGGYNGTYLNLRELWKMLHDPEFA